MKIKVSLLITLFIVLNNTVYGSNEYGLFIKAYPSNDRDKTSLILENNKPIKLDKETTMSFDMYVRKENVFGLVFRAITNNKDNIDLSFTVGENDKRYPMLVINESTYLITEGVKCDEWIPVSITFFKDKNQISIVYNGKQISEKFAFNGVNNAQVSFGMCPIENFTLYDIASVNIRNIKISEGNEVKRFWKLEKYNGNISLDSVASVPAITQNPIWMTNIYSIWKNIYSEKIQFNSMFAYNPEDNRIYIVTPDSKIIKIIDPENRSSSSIETKSGIISSKNASNQIFYDCVRDELVTFNLNENITSRFSFKTNSWSNNVKPTLDNGYVNNSISFSEEDSTIISFGGYGFYKYNNEIIRLNKRGEIIKKSRLPDISPRYSPSTVVVGNTLYIFGGRGNKSGRQELSPKNVYDLYSVNLLTEQVNKLWEDESINYEFLPSENMIFDSSNDCFYLYTTIAGGLLIKIQADKKGFERMSFPIREDLNYHYTHINLYFSPEKKKFYALVNKVNTDNSAEVNIYSLNYPPRPVSTMRTQSGEGTDSDEGLPVMLLSIIIAGGAVLGYLYYIIRRKKKIQGRRDNKPISPENDNKENIQGVNTEKESIAYYDFSKNSICLLGGFYVSDKSGENITGQFSPILKQLLLLLILSTIKDPKGISGKKLLQLLWFDKSEDFAKNNRNVYMSKLRSILENIGNIEIINNNGFWNIEFNEVQCDYSEAIRLFSNLEKADNIDSSKASRLLELLLRGTLLPNTEVDWTDGFKSDFSNLTIDVLKQLVNDDSYKLSNSLKLKIADTIFLHDYVNEDALYLKCSVLYNSGKKGIAKTVFDNFIKEYSASLGVNYKYSFQDVINRKNIEE
jgi:two-component SAPR family response regulator